MRSVIFATVLAATAVVGPVQAQQTPDPGALPAITVTGEGVASVKPDMALVSGGVVARAATASGALQANSAAMTKVLAALKAAGVEDRDVATAGVVVQPRYDYEARAQPGASGPPKLIGYEVRNTLTIRVRALDALGALLDQLVAAGANQIDELSFGVADEATPLDHARRAAVADARRKASLLAEAAGARLGAILSIDERDSGQPVQPFAARAKALDAPAPMAVPIAQGEKNLSAQVTTRWALER